jgi:hypothetical protein
MVYFKIKKGFSYSKIELISNINNINKHRNYIKIIRDSQVSSRILMGASQNEKIMNPIDYCYFSIKTNIKLLERNTEEFNILNHYFNQSLSFKKILKIFKIQRKDELDSFKKYENSNSRYLLWHGSSFSNFLGILNEGLRIAPIEANHSGQMFGAGIYFADTAVKSFGYCDRHDFRSYLFLAEVHLGTPHTIMGNHNATYKSYPIENTDSTIGRGVSGPKNDEYLYTNDGIRIPFGKMESYEYKNISNNDKPTLRYNEFIVYSKDQVKLKYILEVVENEDYDIYLKNLKNGVEEKIVILPQ